MGSWQPMVSYNEGGGLQFSCVRQSIYSRLKCIFMSKLFVEDMGNIRHGGVNVEAGMSEVLVLILLFSFLKLKVDR